MALCKAGHRFFEQIPASMDGGSVINDHALPESLAGVDEARVVLALFLIKLVILEVLEVQDQGKIKGVVGHGAMLGGGGSADKTVLQIRNFEQLDQLFFNRGELIGSEVFFEPEVDVMNHRVRREKD